MPNVFGSGEDQQILRDLETIRWIAILVTAIAAWFAVTIVQRGLAWIADRLPDGFRFYVLPLVPVLRLLILGIAAWNIMVLLIRPSAQNILAIAGALAVALGFAFKDYASSIVAGIVAIFERPYRPGDWVTISGDYGEVRSVGLRAVRIVTPDDTLVTIPNSKIWDNNIANSNDGSREQMCIADFYVQPSHDANAARMALWDIALTSPYTNLRRPITVIVFEKPWATHYRLKAYPIESRNEFLFISDMTVRGKDALHMLDIEPAGLPPMYQADGREGRTVFSTQLRSGLDGPVQERPTQGGYPNEPTEW